MLETLNLVLGLLLLGYGASLQVHVGSDVVVSAGQAVFIRCRVDGEATDFNWYNPQGEKILADNPHFSVRRDDQFISIFISEAADIHAGFYTCVAKASEQEARARIQLLLFHGITFTHAPCIQAFKEGTDAEVLCDAFSSPAPEIVWRKNRNNHTILNGSNQGRLKVLENGHLLIPNIQKEDEDVFHCEARIQALGEVKTKDINVIVHSSLQVHVSPDLHVSVGRSVLIRCRVVGEATDIDWYNPEGEKILADNPDFSVRRGDPSTSVLEISKVAENHAGLYTCVAKNSEQEAKMQLQLYHGIKFTNAPSPQEFKEGTDAEVVCEVFSSPASEIHWRKEHRILNGSNEGRFQVLDNGHLLIHNIQKADEGVFQCEAQIQALGELRSQTINVIVYTSLQAHVGPDLLVSVGRSVLIRCRVVGEATDIDWYNPEGEKILPDNPHFSVSRHDQSTSILMISTVAENHAGFYTCVAKDSEQEVQARMQLQLYHGITFTNAPSPQQFNEGEDAEVVCDVFSSPAPEILWRKEQKILNDFDGHFQVLENGHLLIHNIQKADEGVFHCEARIKALGEIRSQTIKVIVNVSSSFFSLPTLAPSEMNNSTVL